MHQTFTEATVNCTLMTGTNALPFTRSGARSNLARQG